MPQVRLAPRPWLKAPGGARTLPGPWAQERIGGEYDRAMQLSDDAFRTLVNEALDQVPEEFRIHLKGVPVFIEGWPPDDLLDALSVPEDGTLYGLYSGHPITEGPPGSGELPPHHDLPGPIAGGLQGRGGTARTGHDNGPP